MLFDAVVQLAGQAVAFLHHGKGADLIREPGVALVQPLQILLVLLQVLDQEVELARERSDFVVAGLCGPQGQVAAQPRFADLEQAGESPLPHPRGPCGDDAGHHGD